MEITPEQFAKIEHCLPTQRGNVSLSNLQVVIRRRSLKALAVFSWRVQRPSGSRCKLDLTI